MTKLYPGGPDSCFLWGWLILRACTACTVGRTPRGGWQETSLQHRWYSESGDRHSKVPAGPGALVLPALWAEVVEALFPLGPSAIGGYDGLDGV